MRKILVIAFAMFMLVSCKTYKNVSVVRQATPNTGRITLYNIEDKVPNNLIYLGNVSIGDTGFTLICDYDTVLKDAIECAKKMGGNVIHITGHRTPNIWSTCHYIDADVYFQEK